MDYAVKTKNFGKLPFTQKDVDVYKARLNDVHLSDNYLPESSVKIWQEYKLRANQHLENERAPLSVRQVLRQTAVFMGLRKPIRSKSKNDPFLAANRIVLEELSSLLQQGDIRRVLNFGCLYPYIDNILSQNFPNIEFVGIDLYPEVKKLNDEHFKRNNLNFVAGDVFDHLKTAPKYDLLFHVKTLMFCTTKVVKLLYDVCGQASIKHLACYEYAGYSHELNQYYLFNGKMQKSAVLRPEQYVHDYPTFMKESHYEVIHQRLYELPYLVDYQRGSHLCEFVARLGET